MIPFRKFYAIQERETKPHATKYWLDLCLLSIQLRRS